MFVTFPFLVRYTFRIDRRRFIVGPVLWLVASSRSFFVGARLPVAVVDVEGEEGEGGGGAKQNGERFFFLQ
jgi:hypothetical protein